MPPAHTGVADYAHSLAGYLRAHAAIRVNGDGDVNLYNIGNNQLHANIYRRALARPGVVVLHDAVLQHFALGSMSQNEYIDEFVYNYGDWNRSLAQKLWQERRQSAAEPTYFLYPLLKRLAERSKTLVVHNPAAARIVRAHCPAANVVEIPHLVIPHDPPHPAESERFRATLGPGLKFGVFGHLRESKRVLGVLRVFANHPDCVLLLAGSIASSDLRRACEPYLSLRNIRRIGYMSPAEYRSVAGAVDACLNLRFPAAGETSGVSIGMMSGGTPVVMTDSQENSPYPSGTCIKISSGLPEEAELNAIIDYVKRRPTLLREIGAAARAYVLKNHAGEIVAASFARVLAVH